MNKTKRSKVDVAVGWYSGLRYIEQRLDRANDRLNRAVEGLTSDEMAEYHNRTSAMDAKRNEIAEGKATV